jgi:outer membrane lipase/esterase
VKTLLGVLLAAMVMSESRATPLDLDRLVVFGDSLSDIGNAGRFSNGPVWVEYLAERLGLALAPSARGGGNYAVGGARALDLRRQADAFLVAPPADLDRALVVVYGGGNDLRATLYGAPPEATIRDAVRTLAGIVEDLAASGARRILVPNMPDVGLAAEAAAQGAERARLATALSRGFNDALAAALDGIAQRHPALRLHRLDVFALHHEVMADPAAFGFANVREPCAPGCPDPDHWLLWDRTHPTTAAHKLLADAAWRALATP